MTAKIDDSDVTDELGDVADTLDPDAGPMAVWGELSSEAEDFEVGRIFANMSAKLFGVGPGARMGRYEVERLLGSGGMGDVYLGFDPQLERPVALKLLRGLAGPDERGRLHREARAMAKFRHPNVVAVYEIDEHEGRHYVAMEYVEGQTLGAWLAAGRRDERAEQEPEDEAQPRERRHRWREVLARFLAAGRGLVAAHERGIVHRDFKPDNVLLGDDGAVRVADFGLAVSAQGSLQASAAASVRTSASLSMTGTIAGTIKYMPLEQLRGVEVDARSDQFAFCVALYEALWGAPPFVLTDAKARIEALERDAPRVPSTRGVPRALWRIIERGLACEPDARWPDMATLLAALERVPRVRRRRRLALAVGVPLLALASVGVSLWTHADPCAEVSRELDGVWDRALAVELQRDWAELGEPIAASGYRIVAGLDRWAAGWTEAREQQCRAGVEPGDEERSRRATLVDNCMIRQRRAVAQLTTLLAGADGEALANAIGLVGQLPPASACESELALLDVDPPAEAIRAEVESLRTEVERAHQLRRLGRLEEGYAAINAARGAVEKLGYGPLEAEAEAELAKAEVAARSLARGIEHYRASIELADQYRLDRLRAELWVELAELDVVELSEIERGRERLRQASSAYARVGADARAKARLLHLRGRVAQADGARTDATSYYERAIALSESGEGWELPSYLHALAELRADEDIEASLDLRREALEFCQDRYGERHPETARQLSNYGRALILADRDGQGEQEIERAAKIWRELHLHPHAELAEAEFVLGRKALRGMRLDEAERHALKMAEILRKVLPPEHPEHGSPELLLAKIAGVREQAERSLKHARTALASFEASGDPREAERIADAQTVIVSKLIELDELDEASEVLETLLAQARPGSSAAFDARTNLIELQLRLGKLERAQLELEQLDGVELGNYEFAAALLAALVELRRTGKLDGATRTRLARANMPYTQAQLDGWLDQLEVDAKERAKLGPALAESTG